MVDYKCPTCLKNFNKKDSFLKHTEKKKKPCQKNLQEFAEICKKNNSKKIDKCNNCIYCNKNFSSIYTLNRHLDNNCKHKKVEEEKNKKEKDEINKQNAQLEELIKQLKDHSNKFEEISKNNDFINFIDNINKSNVLVKEEPPNFIFNEHVILYRKPDKYINATQLCQASGKKINDWLKLVNTKKIIIELHKNNNKDNKNNFELTLDIQKQYVEKYNENIWIHPDLAIQLAQWISSECALKVSSWIRTLFSNSKLDFNLKLYNEKQNKIKECEKRIKTLENLNLKKQRRKHYPESNVIYLITTEDNKSKNIYIIGKAVNLKERLSTYNKTCEHEVIFYKSCADEQQMELVEKMVIKKLEKYKEQANRDRFVLPQNEKINIFTDEIDKCIDFFN